MRSTTLKSVTILVAVTLLTLAVNAAAQNESIWQKLKKQAKQSGQNAAQQGSQQVQQQMQQLPGGGNQTNGSQSPCGSLTGGNGNNGGNGAVLNNAAYNSGGGGDANFTAGSCGPQCFNAGPFAAAVSQMTMSQQGGWHVIRMNMQFHNSTNQPLIIAYHDGSMVMVDNLGNTYIPAGGYPGAVSGIGIDRGNQTDSQFVLGPGQTANALFSVARGRAPNSAIGTGFAYNLTIDELQPQNGADAIVARTYDLNFPNLAPGANNASFSSPGGVPTNAPGVASGGKGAAVGAAVQGRTPANQMMASPAQRQQQMTNSAPGRGVTTQAPQNAVRNAALRSSPATTAKPAPPVKPIPTRPTDKKPAAKQTSATEVNTR